MWDAAPKPRGSRRQTRQRNARAGVWVSEGAWGAGLLHVTEDPGEGQPWGAQPRAPQDAGRLCGHAWGATLGGDAVATWVGDTGLWATGEPGKPCPQWTQASPGGISREAAGNKPGRFSGHRLLLRVKLGHI